MSRILGALVVGYFMMGGGVIGGLGLPFALELSGMNHPGGQELQQLGSLLRGAGVGSGLGLLAGLWLITAGLRFLKRAIQTLLITAITLGALVLFSANYLGLSW